MTQYLRSHRRLILPFGICAGLLLGIIARAWMRWISTDPEFSWPGTVFIILAFVMFSAVHSFVFFVREGNWTRRKLNFIRISAIFLSLPIFGAAGSIMLPTVLVGSLALWRSDWWLLVRILLGIGATLIPLNIMRGFGKDFGWGIASVGRSLLFVLIYSIVIWATRATSTPLAKD